MPSNDWPSAKDTLSSLTATLHYKHSTCHHFETGSTRISESTRDILPTQSLLSPYQSRPHIIPTAMSHHNCSYMDGQWPHLHKFKGKSLKFLLLFLSMVFGTAGHALLPEMHSSLGFLDTTLICFLPNSLATSSQCPLLISLHLPDLKNAVVTLNSRPQVSHPASWFSFFFFF